MCALLGIVYATGAFARVMERASLLRGRLGMFSRQRVDLLSRFLKAAAILLFEFGADFVQ